MRPFEYVRARDLDHAVGALAEADGDAKVLAGGTSLLFFLRSGLVGARRLVDISRLEGLRGINDEDGGGIVLGALVTHREVERSAVIRRRFPFLADLEREIGTVQMRNRGTVGGNLCHADPSGDLGPAFLAIGGDVEIVGRTGARRVPLDRFFLDFYTTDVQATDILAAVHLRRLPACSGAAYVKYVSRMSNDFTLVGVAAVVVLEGNGSCRDARIAVGGAAPHPFRPIDAEGVLAGERLTPTVLARAAELAAAGANPVSDHRGSADYRREMVRVMTMRALTTAWHGATPEI